MASVMPHDFAAWRAAHPRIAGGDHMTRQELEDRQDAIRTRLQEIHNEFRDQRYPDGVRAEWNDLNDELDRNQETIEELRAREDRIARIAADDSEGRREQGATFRTPSPNRGADVWDYSHVRGATSQDGARQMMRDQALRAVERSRFPHPEADEAACQATVERLLRSDDKHSTVAYRILNTGSERYQRAFAKAITGAPLTDDETRAMGLTNTAGGYAVPYQIDPTIIATSNGSVNPYRRIARNVQITGTTWQGVTASGVTVTRRAEGDEMADNSPTLAQPNATPQRVDAFIPFSFEVGMDWPGMEGELATLIQDGKDEEEALSFTTGTGIAPAAQGIATGATVTVAAGGVASLGVGDLYKVEEALPPRFRPLAQWVANRAIFNKVRQFDTQGGASIWTESLRDGLAASQTGNTGYNLIGYPANEASSMPTATTTGTGVAIFGDFRYFAIVDRIGMDIELVPHLFGANRRPTGQRGLLAFWRNTSVVLLPNAFRKLVTG